MPSCVCVCAKEKICDLQRRLDDKKISESGFVGPALRLMTITNQGGHILFALTLSAPAGKDGKKTDDVDSDFSH